MTKSRKFLTAIGFAPPVPSLDAQQDYHAWFFSDNTIGLVMIGGVPSIKPVCTYRVPSSLVGTAYRITSADATGSPCPEINWLAANNTHAYQMTCGPTTRCFLSSNTIRLATSPLKPVVGITALDITPFPTEWILASADAIFSVFVNFNNIMLISSYTWRNEPFAIDNPTDILTGLTSSYRGRIMASVASTDVTATGYIVAINRSGFKLRQVTMLEHGTPLFNALSTPTHTSPIYYWLEQSPYTSPTALNAFEKSFGGSPNNLVQAGTTLKPGDQWSSGVFTLDPDSRLGLIFAGNYQKTGFTAFTPTYGLGMYSPEVTLGRPTIFPKSLPYTLPTYGHDLFPTSNYRMATAAAMNTQTKTWHELVFDYTRPSPVSEEEAEQEAAHLAAQQASTLMESNSVRNTSRSAAVAANCVKSDCDLENAGSCPVGNCWAQSGADGFICCKHRPF